MKILWILIVLTAPLYTESNSRIGLWQGGAQDLSQAKPVPKQLNLQSLAMEGDLKGCGCPTQPEPILESRAVYSKLSEIDALFKGILSPNGIVKTQQIKIPGYPNAYNPSLIPYKNGYLLSFRYISRFPDDVKGHRTDASFIGVVRLDKKFRPIEKSIQLLNIQSYSSRFTLTAEDGRLVSWGSRIFLIFNDLPPKQKPGFALYLAEIAEEKGVFFPKGPAKLLNYAHACAIEKNWTPFFLEGRLHLIYSHEPRVILEANLETGDCFPSGEDSPNWQWEYGPIRGGTPAYPAEEGFITFFHSCFPANTSKGRAYVMGAYLFDKSPPFQVQAMTIKPLGKLDDYKEDNSAKVIFPTGLVVEGQSIHVAWGKADKQVWITTFNKSALLNSMKR